MIKSRYMYTIIAVLTAHVMCAKSAQANISLSECIDALLCCTDANSFDTDEWEPVENACCNDVYSDYVDLSQCRNACLRGASYNIDGVSKRNAVLNACGTFSCDAGDYWDWDANSGFGACESCSPGTSSGSTTVSSANPSWESEKEASCYVNAGYGATDTTGRWSYTSKCYWSRE